MSVRRGRVRPGRRAPEQADAVHLTEDEAAHADLSQLREVEKGG